MSSGQAWWADHEKYDCAGASCWCRVPVKTPLQKAEERIQELEQENALLKAAQAEPKAARDHRDPRCQALFPRWPRSVR